MLTKAFHFVIVFVSDWRYEDLKTASQADAGRIQVAAKQK